MNMKLAAAAAAILAAACSGQQSQSTSQPASTEMGTTAPMMPAASGAITVQIKALNGSGESGTATLTPMGGKTSVVISITGETATAKQPAHVHKGTCAKLNPAPAYLLKDVVMGKSSTVIAASVARLTAAPMAINIHESAKNIGKYVACGDIKR